eukprot:2036170-Heterocapsa_arctica.AAC.1
MSTESSLVVTVRSPSAVDLLSEAEAMDFFGLVHLVVRELDLVREGLLQELEVVQGRSLLLARRLELRLAFVEEALQCVDDAAALAFISRPVRRAQFGLA